jgi:hypothetical protein
MGVNKLEKEYGEGGREEHRRRKREEERETMQWEGGRKSVREGKGKKRTNQDMGREER